MSAKDTETIIEVPWLPGSKIKIRPMSIKEERKLLTNTDEEYSYNQLVEELCEPVARFTWEKDFGRPERDFLLAQIRVITYGPEMILSGYKCPECGHVNKNHVVNLSEFKIHPFKERAFYTFEKSDLDIEKSRIGLIPQARQKLIKDLVEESDLEGEYLALYEMELARVSVFLDIDLKEAHELATRGELSLYDIQKANHLLMTEYRYGYTNLDKMICHNKECEKEFEIQTPVLAPGWLVPYFGNSGGSSD